MGFLEKIILFDIDGTILLTGGAGKLAFEDVFQRQFQISGAWKNIHPDGRTDPFLIDELFRINLGRVPSASEREAVRQAYCTAMPEALQAAANFRLMPGISECLRYLQKDGRHLLGLATGNFEETSWHKLRRAGLDHYFDFGGFGSDHADRLELTRTALERGFTKLGRRLDPGQVTLIGDTAYDITCGKALGLRVIAVATGSTPKTELAAHEPDVVLDNLGDAALWAKLFA